MKIEIHEVDSGHMLELPEPTIPEITGWIITAVRRQDNKPVTLNTHLGRIGRVFTSEEDAIAATKFFWSHVGFSRIRIHKVSV